MRLLIAIISVLFTLPLFAQKAKRVCGEYTYYAEGNESPNLAKQKSLEGARINALAKEFGTVLSQSTLSISESNQGDDKDYFSQLSSSEVKGEWLEDLGEPEYKIDFIDNMLIVNCKVCGTAREITNEAADFETMVLRNGVEKRFASTKFVDGDNLFVQFRSPQDGYVAVYLVDETPTAFCLLPYMDNTSGQQAVKHNEEYVFFSPKDSKTGCNVDEFVITCAGEVERNMMYVIFSPKPFSKAMDNQVDEDLPRQLPYEKFSEWLTKCRKRDPKMGLKVIHLEIKK